jgi:hypothetical protein
MNKENRISCIEHGLFSPMNHFNHLVDNKVNHQFSPGSCKNQEFWSLKFTKFSNPFWKLKILDRVCLCRTNFGGTKLLDRKWLMWSRIFGYKDHLRISSISRTNFPTSTISGLYLVIHLKITCSFVVWFIVLLCSTRHSCALLLEIH